MRHLVLDDYAFSLKEGLKEGESLIKATLVRAAWKLWCDDGMGGDRLPVGHQQQIGIFLSCQPDGEPLPEGTSPEEFPPALVVEALWQRNGWDFYIQDGDAFRVQQKLFHWDKGLKGKILIQLGFGKPYFDLEPLDSTTQTTGERK